MNQKVMLSIEGRQTYRDQEPEIIQLTTEGTLEFTRGGWDIRYEESELTGLQGTVTVFRVEPGQLILERSGALNSRMEFAMGRTHESLYQMEFGALMLSVTARHLFYDIGEEGGVVDLSYDISIENCEAGQIDYHLVISPLS